MPIALQSGGTAPDPTLPDGTPAPVLPRRGFEAMTWTGVDGSVWDVLDWTSGAFLMRGVTGLMPEAASPWVSKAGAHGQSRRGHRFEARSVLWPTLVFHDGTSSEFVDLYEAWWDSFSYDNPGVWEVAGPDGAKRRLHLVLEDSGDSPEFDPTLTGWVKAMTKLVADVPFWEGDPISMQWGKAGVGAGFFEPESGGVLRISGGFTTAQAAISNPGKVESWPVWTLRGPWTTASLGVDGRLVKVPFAGTATDTLVVDTQAASAYLNGVECSERLASWEWAPVPPGKSVPLDVTLEGDGNVSASLTPLYYRAVG